MNLSLISLCFGIICGTLIPVCLLIWWKRKTGVKLKPFIIGAVCFIVFANVLESVSHMYFILGENTISSAINSSPILFTLYTCLAAGIFEETGRLCGFKYFLKNSNNPDDAFAYGIGHGGIEVILVLVLNYLVYLLIALGLNIQGTNDQIVAVISSISPIAVLLALLERSSAMLLHIGLSLLVYIAVKKAGKFYFYPLSILIHGLFDVPAALFQFGVIKSVIVIETLLLIISILCFINSYKTFKKEFNK